MRISDWSSDVCSSDLRVLPLIFEAETYETAAPVEPGHVHDHDAPDHDVGAAHEHSHAGWAPQDGLERTLYTLLVNVLTGIGFGLLLAAAFALRGGADWRSGLYWGAAGFVTFTLAPALGLPPEIDRKSTRLNSSH